MKTMDVLSKYKSDTFSKWVKKLRITIFTYDYNARISMLKQLREMNNKRIDLLYSPSDLNIFMTDGGENDSIEGFLEGFDYRIRYID